MAERFLIVRLGALGDIVHAIPVAAALRHVFPAARIDWLVSARHRELLDLVPVVSRRLVINDRPTAATSPDAASVGGSWWRTILDLRRARYDAAIDLQGLIKSAMLARASGAQRVLGFSASYLREPFGRVFYTDVHDPGGSGLFDARETRHVVEINLGLLRLLGIAAPAREFPIDAVDSAVARDVQRQTDGRYALLNPGAAWPNKRWPPERLGAIAAGLRDRHGLRSVVLWGPGEEALAREAVAASAGAAIVSPKTTIADIVAIARGASVMLSGDTGPTHLAAAVGTPLVGLYGPTRAHRNGPWSPADITISREAICQCHHLRRCRVSKMCLLDIEVAEVAAALDRRLAAEAAHVHR